MAAVFWALALASLCYPLASINAQSHAAAPSKLPIATSPSVAKQQPVVAATSPTYNKPVT
ncbi:hypothetical protein A2U01_0039837, partial [Trifolium medium]|nr:hypothetical protein [Trifolium medium]